MRASIPGVVMIAIALSFPVATPAFAQRTSPIGLWKTVDDATGMVRSVIEIFERDGALFGKVVENLDMSTPDMVCAACAHDDPRRGQPVLGMEVMRNLVRSGDVWHGGDVLDPEKGNVYRCKVWLEEGELRLRGYLAFFYRTQTWLPAD